MLGLILCKANKRDPPPQNFAIVEETLQKGLRTLAASCSLADFRVVTSIRDYDANTIVAVGCRNESAAAPHAFPMYEALSGHA